MICLLLLSSATALSYEVLWARMLRDIFGNTAQAVATVTAAFMAGLALGGYFGGRLADRRQRLLPVYGLLQLMLSLCAIAFPLALDLLRQVNHWAFYSVSPMGYVICRFVLAIALLLVPTTLMGAVFPIIGKLWIRSCGRLGQSAATVYAVDTCGAVIGCLVCGFFCLEHFGFRGTLWLGAATNLLVAVLAFALPRESSEKRCEERPTALETGDTASYGERLATIVLATIAGYSSLALEVLWTRALVHVISTSVYAFPTILSAYLLGIAGGSYLVSRHGDRSRERVPALGALLTGAGLAALGTTLLLDDFFWINSLLGYLFGQHGVWSLHLMRFVAAGLVVLLPAFLFGAIFPLAVRGYADPSRAGRGLGGIYAANTTGAVLGSLSGGFFIMPLLGVRRGIVVVGALALSVGLLAFVLRSQRIEKRRIALALGAALVGASMVFLVPNDGFRTFFALAKPGSTIAFIDEGVSGTATIHEYPWPRARELAINGTNVAGESMELRTTQKFQAHIPMNLHRAPHRVMQVGLGSGETVRTLLLYDVEHIDVVEISAEIAKAARQFTNINGGALDDPRVSLIMMDAKNYASLTRQKYDVIMNDSIHPALSGNSSLYAREYFLACRGLLEKGGIMTSWFPLFGLTARDFSIVVTTFADVFPYWQLYLPANGSVRHAVIVGAVEPETLTIDMDRLAGHMLDPSIDADLTAVRLSSPYSFLASFITGWRGAAKMTYGLPVNSDERPILEFSSARTWGPPRLILAENLQTLFDNLESVAGYLAPGSRPLNDLEAAKVETVSREILLGDIYQQRGDQKNEAIHKALAFEAHRLLMNRWQQLRAENAMRRRDLTTTQRATALYDTGHFADAAALAKEVEADDPELPTARWITANCLFHMKRDKQEILAALNEAVSSNSNRPGLWLSSSQIYLYFGDLAAAEKALDRARELAPNWATIYAVTAILNFFTNDNVAASENIGLASFLDAGCPFSYYVFLLHAFSANPRVYLERLPQIGHQEGLLMPALELR
ncbi:MAG: fused MFS/spermidine synthase [Deltaproteobacteria bacterium]|nr:fused MFS/spermidine synthase [Deltaproteobacteria bacterium]